MKNYLLILSIIAQLVFFGQNVNSQTSTLILSCEDYVNYYKSLEGLPSFYKDSNLKQIALIRHAKPVLSREGKFNNKQAQQYLDNYKIAGVGDLNNCTFKIEKVDVSHVYCSILQRAKETAIKTYGKDFNIIEDELFVEFDYKILRIPLLKFKIDPWLISSRIAWLLGKQDADTESFREAKQRAAKCVEKLESLAVSEKKVVLVAHGFLIRSLKKMLKKKGWCEALNGGHGYQNASLLVKSH